ncbi:ABC-2 type transport system permease protein [Terribacillus aidingensis]|uniref:ABC-2 type transport system permease protein n=1 Tax=Terribacillus aidingensis TaxID=586416 RepID=A0A285PA24_9BACI|nr:ABC transporter permease subunit [Terribacillus aidingensis]SNZ16986.1 ABC-2 type transport system permease protein [Terribacillus aidingensis]
MSKFIGLVRNEHMKTFRRLSTWILLGILLGMFILIAGITKYYAEDGGNWRQSSEQQVAELQKQAEQTEDPVYAASLQEDMAVLQYQLDNDIAPIQTDSVLGFMLDALLNCGPFLIMFIAIIAGGMVSNEFSTGTIKLLLTKTPSRFSVLTSKYVSMLFTTFLFTVAFLLFSFIVGVIFFGFDGLTASRVVLDNGEIVKESGLGALSRDIGYGFIQVAFYGTIAFALSTLFRNSALAIGFSIFIALFFPTISYLIARYDWSKYILFNNLDLSAYTPGNTPIVDGMTLGFSVVVMLVYFIIITAITWLSFIKRDVTA